MALFCRFYFPRRCDLQMLIRNCTILKVKHDEYTGFNLVNGTGCTVVYKTND